MNYANAEMGAKFRASRGTLERASDLFDFGPILGEPDGVPPRRVPARGRLPTGNEHFGSDDGEVAQAVRQDVTKKRNEADPVGRPARAGDQLIEPAREKSVLATLAEGTRRS